MITQQNEAKTRVLPLRGHYLHNYCHLLCTFASDERERVFCAHKNLNQQRLAASLRLRCQHPSWEKVLMWSVRPTQLCHRLFFQVITANI